MAGLMSMLNHMSHQIELRWHGDYLQFRFYIYVFVFCILNNIKQHITQNKFLDAQASLASTLVSPSSVGCRPSVHKSFGFPFCQRLWALTKRRDDIAVSDMVADTAADMHGGAQGGRQGGHHGGRHGRWQKKEFFSWLTFCCAWWPTRWPA